MNIDLTALARHLTERLEMSDASVAPIAPSAVQAAACFVLHLDEGALLLAVTAGHGTRGIDPDDPATAALLPELLGSLEAVTRDDDAWSRTTEAVGVRFNGEVVAAVALSATNSATAVRAEKRKLQRLALAEMEVSAVLGQRRMTVREILSLVPGQLVELDRPAGEPIDLMANGTLFARGEVVVIDGEEFGVRITEIVADDDEG